VSALKILDHSPEVIAVARRIRDLDKGLYPVTAG